MPMLHVFRVGPAPGSTLALYAGWYDGQVLATPSGSSGAEALRLLAARVPEGTALRCSPDLADVARSAGFTVAEPPEDVRWLRAGIALQIAAGPLGPPNPLLWGDFLGAAAALWRAEPWERRRPDQVVAVRLAGGIDARREVLALGAAGQARGLAILPARTAWRFVRAARSDDERQMKEIELLMLAFEAGGAAAEPVKSASGLEVTPNLRAMKRGRPVALRDDDVVLATAICRGLAALRAPGRATVTAQGREVVVELGEVAS